MLDGPFAVINADDFYGRSAYEKIFDFLHKGSGHAMGHYAMIGYELYKTLTDNGHVARGVCRMDADGNLADITEHTRIEKHGTVAEYTDDEGKTWNPLPGDTIVSMNLWGFTEGILEELEQAFTGFLRTEAIENPCKSEFFLPFVVDRMIHENKARVTVLKSGDKWYGVTYKEDKQVLVNAVKQMRREGRYPEYLWEERK